MDWSKLDWSGLISIAWFILVILYLGRLSRKLCPECPHGKLVCIFACPEKSSRLSAIDRDIDNTLSAPIPVERPKNTQSPRLPRCNP